MTRCLVTFAVIAVILSCPIHLSLASERHVEASLKLAGEVIEVKENTEFSDKDYISFDVKLRLHFINTNSKPVILPLGMYDWSGWWIGGNRIARSTEEVAARNYLWEDSHWPSNSSTSPTWVSLRNKISQQTPPSELTHIIAPKVEFILVTSTFLKFRRNASNDDFDKSQPWSVIKEISPMFLSVTLEMWPINLETVFPQSDHRLGKKLQKRWRNVGDLHLEYLTSEPIKFDFLEIKRMK